MLTHDELVELYRTHRQDRVLSVYLNGKATDFAERSAWRRHFDQGVSEARKRLEGSEDRETKAFEQALEQVKKELQKFDSFLPGNGFVAFATPGSLIHGGAIRVPMPDLVRWEEGIRVAPYVRALKQERPVVTVLVDSRRARIFEYRGGELTESLNLNAETFLGDLTDINVSKRPTAHSGVRGKTGTDAAQKFLNVGSERMMKKLGEKVADAVGDGGHLVLGGTPEAVNQARTQLPGNLNGRMIEPSGLRVEMSDAEVRTALEQAASELNQSNQEKLLGEVEDLARSGGRGALGAETVEQALREARVDTLLLSRGFIRANPDYADHLVGAAFEQHAEVEELSLNGAQRLDTEGEGVAARLRYTL
ncbi:MAG: hypothetical protein EA351_08690 [Gemmatimonadales bacterium]|nr:MAG: hypothetical protein EA351_08690 [Gemmatimonadales bacterium]